MSTKKIINRYKYKIKMIKQHVVIDSVTDTLIGISPTFENAQVLVKLLNKAVIKVNEE